MQLIILDRDGVINGERDDYVKSPEEWEPIAGSLEAIAKLNQAGLKVVIATNQSGIARGLFSQQHLDLMHKKMQILLNQYGGFIDQIYVCPHHPDVNCLCRKPKLGLFYKIAEDFPVDWRKSYFIGDSWTDMQAARTIQCQPILVKTGRGLITAQNESYKPYLINIPVLDNLAQAVDFILGLTKAII